MPIRTTMRPSLLARSACSSFSAALRPSASSSSTPVRTFTASSRCHADNPSLSKGVPPESPNYIKYPQPPQSEETYRPPRRGHLPVPRDIFKVERLPGRKKDDPSIVPKTDADAFVASAAPRSKAEQRGDEPRSERESWRRRMADSRRQSLQSGLSGLWSRQQKETKRAHARSENVFNRNRNAALSDVERNDDRWTRSSVRDATAKVTAVIRDPHRHERQAESAERTAAIAQTKREARRDALMELYQAAGNFIVDEKGLEERVNELFRPNFFNAKGYDRGSINAENIWDVAGKPLSVQDMMTGITRTETKIFDSRRTEVNRTTKRQKLVAEALTGGKMP